MTIAQLRWICGLLVGLIIGSIPFAGWAEDNSERPLTVRRTLSEPPGYCDWVIGSTDSERAKLLYPELYSTVGPVSNGDEDSGDENSILDKLAMRLTIGLQYRFINLYKGVMMGRRAGAECLRYRAQAALQAALATGNDWGRLEALEAQARVLDDALPEAAAQLDHLYEQLANNLVTVEELYAAQLKVDTLKQMRSRVSADHERLSNQPAPPSESLEAIIQRYEQADDAVEARSADIRRSEVWALDIKGGYDQTFGNQKEVPLFAQLKVSFNFGAFAQPSAERRAAAGRKRWRAESPDAIGVKLAELRHNLATALHAERRRLDDVGALADELQQRLNTLERIQTEKSRQLRDLLWLDYVRMDAEREYLRLHVKQLETVVGDNG